MNDTKSKLIILSGPSGVGKGPMTAALEAYCKTAGKSLAKHVLFNNRAKRAGEKDGITYHFLSKDKMNEMIKLDKDKSDEDKQYFCFDLSEENRQMLDKEKLKEELSNNDLVFLEILRTQINIPKKVAIDNGCDVKEIFISPLSDEDFADLGVLGADRDSAATAVMLSKLINRGTEKRNDQLKRAQRAAGEISNARANSNGNDKLFFTNHFGEDNSRLWDSLHDVIKKGLLHKPNELLDQPGGLEILQTFLAFRDLVFTSENCKTV